MRIVAVADTHTFESDLGQLPSGDLLIHTGDLCRAGTLQELRPAAEWFRGQMHEHKIVVAGNHDWCFVHDRAAACALLGEEVIYLEDAAVTIEGLRIWGTPWQPEFHSWAFNLPRGAALADKWALIPDDTDVLITHGPPFGFGDRTGYSSGRCGCEDLLQALDRVQPALHLFGHIHDGGGVWRRGETTLLNVSTWECERAATVIDIDPATQSIALVDIPPSGRRS